MTKKQAYLELIVAGIFWGFGFIAIQWALMALSPSVTLVLRFFIAFVVGEFFSFIVLKSRIRPSGFPIKKALIAGALLGSCLLLQTIGLQFTSASNSGFITCLYIIMIPIFSQIVFKEHISKFIYLYAGLALFGAYLMMDSGIDRLNQGDLWTLACSFLAAAHILYIGKISSEIHNPFRFNVYQSFFAMLFLLPSLLLPNIGKMTHLPPAFLWPYAHLLPFLGLMVAAIGCSLFAFFLQVRAQKLLSSTEAGMLFLLESPFAMLFGVLLFEDEISLKKAVGAALILCTAALTVLSSRSKT